MRAEIVEADDDKDGLLLSEIQALSLALHTDAASLLTAIFHERQGAV